MNRCNNTTKVAYCWGANNYGQLGDGTGLQRLVPTAVSGDVTFAQVSAAVGGVHACGISRAGRAYCWGHNGEGELGDGTTTQRLEPTPVIGPS
jgi:alpha-tubulin suppressor-like RCC1 family protein